MSAPSPTSLFRLQGRGAGNSIISVYKLARESPEGSCCAACWPGSPRRTETVFCMAGVWHIVGAHGGSVDPAAPGHWHKEQMILGGDEGARDWGICHPHFPGSRLLPGSRGEPSPSLEPSLFLFFSSALSAEGWPAEEQDGQKYIFMQLLRSAVRETCQHQLPDWTSRPNQGHVEAEELLRPGHSLLEQGRGRLCSAVWMRGILCFHAHVLTWTSLSFC